MQLGKEEKKEGKEGQEGVEEEKEFVVRGLGLGQKEKYEEGQGRQGEKGNAWAESEAWTEGARGKGEGSEKENHQWREQGKFGGTVLPIFTIHTHLKKYNISESSTVSTSKRYLPSQCILFGCANITTNN